ncbi:unnamed protein product [Moneuplotes crassus]|uniref:cystathionine gamma-lyase n=1 Tax=Euplotes crassus TaxID=5936 RepID=A0AAD1UJT4_EUPCR|nr:unnamed protein product [Moneuplotes crassus]
MKSITREDKLSYYEDHHEIFDSKAIDTRAVHVGQPSDAIHGSINVPIHMTSIYSQEDCGVPTFDHMYGRDGNPTRDALEKCIASLENGKFGLVANSCMSVSMLAIHLLKHGDGMICIDDICAATGTYLKKIVKPNYGIEIDYVNFRDTKNIEDCMKENTKMVWMESPSNPLLEIYDIKAVAEICKENNIILVVDNTLMSPYFQNPLQLGATIVIQSVTKYLGGHSDLVMGALVTNDEDLYQSMRETCSIMGQTVSPMDCYLVLRSLKTFPLRMKKINKNGTKVAAFLEENTQVDKVYYPMLKSHEGYELHKSQATGGAGLVCFELKDADCEEAKIFLKSLKIFELCKSLGGVQSCASCPSVMSHKKMPKEEREKIGIKDGLIRLAIGVEDIDDIIEDLEQALKKIQ